MGFPKACAKWRGHSFLWHSFERLKQIHAEPIAIVLGAHPLDEAIAELVPDPAPLLCHNADWPSGPFSSLQCGLRAILQRAEVDACLIATVDRPRVRSQTLEALLDAARTEPEAIWQPRYRDHSAHPILLPRQLFGALLALPPDQPSGLRGFLRAPSQLSKRRFVDVDDPGVVENFDSPADLEALQEA